MNCNVIKDYVLYYYVRKHYAIIHYVTDYDITIGDTGMARTHLSTTVDTDLYNTVTRTATNGLSKRIDELLRKGLEAEAMDTKTPSVSSALSLLRRAGGMLQRLEAQTTED